MARTVARPAGSRRLAPHATFRVKAAFSAVFACALVCVAGGGAVEPTGLHAAVPTSAAGIPMHLPVVEFLGRDFSGHLRQYPDYVTTMARYVDLTVGEFPPFYARIPALAGADFTTCMGSRGVTAFGGASSGFVGANQYARPDCSQRDAWPDSAFFRSPRDGKVLTDSDSGSGGLFQVFADPNSPIVADNLRHIADDVFARYPHLRGLYFDNFGFPGMPGDTVCDGVGVYQSPHKYVCSSSLKAESAFESPQHWLHGMRALLERLDKPVFVNALNGLYDPGDSSSVPLVSQIAGDRSILGEACDNCFFQPNAYEIVQQLRGAMRVIAAGKAVMVLNEGATDPAVRASALAIVALFVTPDSTYVDDNECGAASLIAACPEVALTFLHPQETVDDPDKLPRHGAFLTRSFAQCGWAGRPLGPCTTYVNPTRDALDLTLRGDHPQYTIAPVSGTKSSLCGCFGDDAPAYAVRLWTGTQRVEWGRGIVIYGCGVYPATCRYAPLGASAPKAELQTAPDDTEGASRFFEERLRGAV
jgi:hypothetical protein